MAASSPWVQWAQFETPAAGPGRNPAQQPQPAVKITLDGGAGRAGRREVSTLVPTTLDLCGPSSRLPAREVACRLGSSIAQIAPPPGHPGHLQTSDHDGDGLFEGFDLDICVELRRWKRRPMRLRPSIFDGLDQDGISRWGPNKKPPPLHGGSLLADGRKETIRVRIPDAIGLRMAL